MPMRWFKKIGFVVATLVSITFANGSLAIDAQESERIVPRVKIESLHQSHLAQTGDIATSLERIKVGVILTVKGKVTVLSADGVTRKAEARGEMFLGDKVMTGKRSVFQGFFPDGSTMRLAEKSDFTINEYYFNEDKGEAKSDVSVSDGTISFLAAKIAKIAPQNYKIRTQTATVGIRGSAGELRVKSGNDGGAFTQARVAPGGHVLEVSSSFGTFTLDDPGRALEVTPAGIKWFPVEPGKAWVDSEDHEL